MSERPLQDLYWTATIQPKAFGAPVDTKNPKETFFGLQYHQPSSLSVVHDYERGAVWCYDKQPNIVNDKDLFTDRCETSALTFGEEASAYYKDWIEWENNTYRFSWSSKFDAVTLGNHQDNFVIFQWKSHDYSLAHAAKVSEPTYDKPLGLHASSQWYPFLMRIVGGNLQLIHSNFEGAWLIIWSHTIQANVWVDIALEIFMSKDKTKGLMALYFNGARQTFLLDQNGAVDGVSTLFRGRTFDTDGNYPKWGVYRNSHPEFCAKHFVDRLYIKQLGGAPLV